VNRTPKLVGDGVVAFEGIANVGGRAGAFAADTPVIAREFNDGGGSRFASGTGVEDEREAVAELREDIDSAGASGRAGKVGAGAGERDAEFGDQIGDETTIGPAESDAPGVGGNLQRKTIRGVNNNGERSGPAGLRETKEIVGKIAGKHLGVNERTDEDGKSLGLGTSFNAEDFVDGGEIDGIGSKGVESVGGNGHNCAAIQPTGCVANDVRVGMRGVNLQNLCRQ
jgi:hypothetical protein